VTTGHPLRGAVAAVALSLAGLWMAATPAGAVPRADAVSAPVHAPLVSLRSREAPTAAAAAHRAPAPASSQGAVAKVMSVLGLMALVALVILVVGRRRGTDRYRTRHDPPEDTGAGDGRRGPS